MSLVVEGCVVMDQCILLSGMMSSMIRLICGRVFSISISCISVIVSSDLTCTVLSCK